MGDFPVLSRDIADRRPSSPVSEAPHRAAAVMVGAIMSVASQGAVQVDARNIEWDPFVEMPALVGMALGRSDEGSVAPDSERLVDLWGDDERR